MASVAATVQSVLGFTPAPEQPLMEAGLDSLGAVELRNALGSRFGIPDLPATLTFDYATIAALAGYIAGIPHDWLTLSKDSLLTSLQIDNNAERLLNVPVRLDRRKTCKPLLHAR